MGYELPIVRITKPGVSYDSYNSYKIGEVLELSSDVAQKLIGNKQAEEVGKRELKKWENYKFSYDFKKKEKAERLRKHKFMKLKIDNYTDNAEVFYEHNPFFYDATGIFWFWNQGLNLYEQKDDIDVMNMFDDILGFQGQTVSSNIKNNHLEAFKRVGRKKKPKDAPNKWIQFKGKAYSLSSGMVYDVNPDFFFTNPIPYSFGDTEKTPIMDKLFTEWVGIENIPLLYEIIAYCCYRGYPMQLLFSLVGNGRNGKSCFLRLLSRFIGKENICSTELDLLVGHTGSRFESFKLYKKLVCLMGETNFGTLNRSSMLKKLTGGDMIGFEMKGKNPFDEYNYAKMIIASNSLPSSNDTSEGFYRRWVIIDFPNQFPEGKDILKDIPEKEYSNLALKVTQILPKLLKDGKFTNQGKIEERKQKYIMASNPLPIFLDLFCNKFPDVYIGYNELYVAYLKYLKANKKRRVMMKEFKDSLEDEGYWVERTSKKTDDDEWRASRWIDGVELKEGWEKTLCQLCRKTKNSHLWDVIPVTTQKKLHKDINDIKSPSEMEVVEEIIE